jgi:PAS domain S-box-containing protein/putative nucleotidyltransferase with HDIG domain
MIQKPRSDPKKLKSMLESVPDQEKIRILNKLAGSYQELPPKDRIAFAEQASDLSERFHDHKSEAEAYNHLGVAYNNMGNSHQSVGYFLKALEIMERIHDEDGIANSYVNLGQANFYLDDFDKALKYFQKALAVRERIGDKSGVSQSLILVGNVMGKTARYDEALDYYFKALTLKEEIDDKIGISQIYNNLGNIYFETEQPKKALEYRVRSLQIDRELGDKWEVANTAFNIAEGYLQGNQPEKAYPYILESQEISNELQNKGLIRDNLHNLSLYHELRGEYQKALKYQREYSEATKTLFSKELGEKVAEMEIKYETEKLEELVAERTQELQRKINELKQTEKALRESEERLDIAVTGANLGLWDLDVQTGKAIYSSQWYKMLGYSIEEIEPQLGSWKNLVHPDDEQQMMETLNAHFDGKTPVYEAEFRMRTKSGEWKWILSTGKLFERDDDGRPLRMAGLNRDITERVQAKETLERSYAKLQRALEGTVYALAATVETRDPYTSGHQRRVTQLTCAIAEEMGLSRDQIEGIRVAGLIHDIGKISIPAEILSKPRQLTDTEFSLLKAHPKVAYDILKRIEFPWPVADIVVQHHERLDGSGYPNGVKGDEILLEARILAVADVVEAMASHRPYRPARGIDKALEEIEKNTGKLYDPKIVDVCLKLFHEEGFEFEE